MLLCSVNRNIDSIIYNLQKMSPLKGDIFISLSAFNILVGMRTGPVDIDQVFPVKGR